MVAFTTTGIAAAREVRRANKIREAERELASAHWQKPGLVFTTGVGTALSPRNVGRSFDEAIIRAGVPRMRLHDLRHVSASLDLQRYKRQSGRGSPGSQ